MSATIREPRPDEVTRFTVYGYPRGQRVSPGYGGVPLGHRPTLDEARAVAVVRSGEGYAVVRIVERERDYPYTHLRQYEPRA